jgi:hypothetical protein
MRHTPRLRLEPRAITLSIKFVALKNRVGDLLHRAGGRPDHFAAPSVDDSLNDVVHLLGGYVGNRRVADGGNTSRSNGRKAAEMTASALFTDSRGRRWTVIDYRVVGGKKKRVELGSWRAEGRAFVPDGWAGAVMLHPFGYVACHDTEPRTLEGQLRPHA